MADANLTAERLREALDYDPETGVFTWAKDVLGGHGKRQVVRKKGQAAGCRCRTRGYVLIRIDGALHLAHRLAWLFVHGVWPTRLIDHINGDGSDNRIANLRDASDAVNAQNVRCAKRRRIQAPLGVSYAPRAKRKWMAQITADGEVHYLGLFLTKEEAHEAYLTAKRRFHEGCTI